MKIDIYELRSEIMDVLHVLEFDPDEAHDLLVKMSEKYEAAQQSVQADECPVCWGRGFNYVFEAQIDCAACNGTGIRR